MFMKTLDKTASIVRTIYSHDLICETQGSTQYRRLKSIVGSIERHVNKPINHPVFSLLNWLLSFNVLAPDSS